MKDELCGINVERVWEKGSAFRRVSGKCESRFFCAPKKVQATTRLEIKRAHFDESLALFAKKQLSISFEREKISLLERLARLQIPISPLEELLGGGKKNGKMMRAKNVPARRRANFT